MVQSIKIVSKNVNNQKSQINQVQELQSKLEDQQSSNESVISIKQTKNKKDIAQTSIDSHLNKNSTKNNSKNRSHNAQIDKILTEEGLRSPKSGKKTTRNYEESIGSPRQNQQDNEDDEEFAEDQQFLDDINEIREMGVGGFGAVHQVVHLRKEEYFARKKFHKEADFIEERSKQLELEHTFEDLDTYTMVLERQISRKLLLFYKLGLVSLTKFNELKNQENISWKPSDIYYIFSKLIIFVHYFNDEQELVQPSFQLYEKTNHQNIVVTQNNLTTLIFCQQQQINQTGETVSLPFQEENQLKAVILKEQDDDQDQPYQGFNYGRNYTFQFKVNKCTGTIGLGIYSKDQNEFTFNKLNGNYLFNDGQFQKMYEEIKETDLKFKEGDSVTIHLNCQNRSLTFIVSDQYDTRSSQTFYDIFYDQDEHYFPLVILTNMGDSVQLDNTFSKQTVRYFHGDIKPDNIVLHKNDDKQLEIKVIDLAGASSELYQRTYTPEYFGYPFSGDYLFEQRYQNEIYTILRTFMKLSLSSVSKSYSYLPFKFHIEHKHKYLQIFSGTKEDNIIRSNSDTTKKFAITSLNHIYKYKNEQPVQFSFFIKKMKKESFIAIGICNKEIVCGKAGLELNDTLDHGAYAITSNGKILRSQEKTAQDFSDNLLSYNSIYIDPETPFKFEEGDTIICEYSQNNKQITFTIRKGKKYVSNSQRQKIVVDVDNKFNNSYPCPCCILESQGDQIEYENGAFISQYFQRQKQSKADNLNLMNEIKDQIFKEYYDKNEDNFRDYFDFLLNLCQMNFNREQIEEFINRDFFKNQHYISDDKQILQKYIKKQMEIYQKNYKQSKNKQADSQDTPHPMEMMFQSQTYIKGTMCTASENNNKNQQDLDKVMKQFIINQNEKQIFILVGDSGTGKSSFLLNLQRGLNQESKDYGLYVKTNNVQVNYIKLGNYASLQELEKEVTKQIEKKNKNKQGRSFIFLLDGYDEITFKDQIESDTIVNLFRLKDNTNQFQPIDNNLDKQKKKLNLKVIITSRKENLPQGSLDKIFKFEEDNQKNKKQVQKKIEFYYICLFSEDQIEKFIEHYIKTLQKDEFLGQKCYDSKEDYMKQFNENQDLKQLATNPLLLRIIAEVLPGIQEKFDKIKTEYENNHNIKTENKQIKELKKRIFSKYNLYKEFLKNWHRMKIEKLEGQKKEMIQYKLCNQEVAELNHDREFDLNDEDLNDNEEDTKLLKNIDIFNKNLAYGLFLCQKLTFTKEQDFVQQIFVENPLQNNHNLGMSSNMNSNMSSTMQHSYINEVLSKEQEAIQKKVENFLLCSPFKKSLEGHYEYIHKSIYEFFIADQIKTEIESIMKHDQDFEENIQAYQNNKMGNSNGKQNINQNQTQANIVSLRNIPQPNLKHNQNENIQELIQHWKNLKLNSDLIKINHIAIIRIVQNYFILCVDASLWPVLKRSLQRVIKYSSYDINKNEIQFISSNCATLYNSLGLSFSGLDLSNCQLRGAILQQAILHNTNLEGANLKDANLCDSILTDSNLKNAQIQNAYIGKSPDFDQKKPVLAVQYSPDGKLIATGNDEGTIRLYKTDHLFSNQSQMRVHEQGVNCLAFSSDSKYLVSGSSDKSIHVFEISDDYEQNQIGNNDNKQDGYLKQFSFKKNAHEQPITSISISYQNTERQWLKVASSSEDSKIYIWTINVDAKKNAKQSKDQFIQQKVKIPSEIKNCCITTLVFYKEQGLIERLASGSEDENGTIFIWEIKKEIIPKQKIKSKLSMVSQIAVSTDSKYMVAGSSEEIVIWKFKTSKELNILRPEWIQEGTIESGAVCLSFSNDSRIIASGDRLIKLWSVETRQLMQTIEGHSQVNSICFSPTDLNSIASGNYDNSLKIYTVDIEQSIKEMHGHQQDVTAVAVSGNIIASGGQYGYIKLWDIQTYQEILTCKGRHTQGITQLIFGNGEYQQQQFLVSAGGILIRIWDVEDGSQLRTLYGHQDNINSLSLNSLNLLVSGSSDNTIKIWNLQECIKHHFNKIKVEKKNSDTSFNSSQNHFQKEALQDIIDQNSQYSDTSSSSQESSEEDDIYNTSIDLNSQVKIPQQLSKSYVDPIPYTLNIESCVNTVLFNPEGDNIVFGCEDRKIRVYSIESNEIFLEINENTLMNQSDNLYDEDYDNFSEDQRLNVRNCLHQGPILCLAFSLDGSQLASAGQDINIKIWSIQREGSLLTDITTTHGDVKTIQYLQDSPNGQKRIASGGANYQICIWNVKTNTLLETIQGHTGIIQQIIFFDYEIPHHSEKYQQQKSQVQQYLISCAKSIKIWIKQEKKDGKYLLDRNISKSQAFFCKGLKFDQPKESELQKLPYQDQLNIKLLVQDFESNEYNNNN